MNSTFSVTSECVIGCASDFSRIPMPLQTRVIKALCNQVAHGSTFRKLKRDMLANKHFGIILLLFHFCGGVARASEPVEMNGLWWKDNCSSEIPHHIRHYELSYFFDYYRKMKPFVMTYDGDNFPMEIEYGADSNCRYPEHRVYKRSTTDKNRIISTRTSLYDNGLHGGDIAEPDVRTWYREVEVWASQYKKELENGEIPIEGKNPYREEDYRVAWEFFEREANQN